MKYYIFMISLLPIIILPKNGMLLSFSRLFQINAFRP
jgi:hypothetical protein